MAFTGKATFSAGADLGELIEDVSDVIGIISPHETPLLDLLGDPKRPALSTVHEWLEDSLIGNQTHLDQSVFDPDPETETDLTVDDGSIFQVGDLVRPGESTEVMLVTAVSGNDLTVARAYGGTANATLADDMTLVILGNAALEGADAPAARFTNRVRRRNYTQIFTATVDVSGSMQAARAHGVADEVDYQKQERMRELLRDLENCVINGVAASGTPQGDASVRRTMNGIIHSIATNVFEPGIGDIPSGGGPGGKQLTEEVLNAALRQIWERSSAGVDTIVVNGSQKRRINSFISSARGYSPSDERVRDLVSVYESDFGVARVVLSRWVPADTLLMLDSSRIEVMPLSGRSFQFKPLANVGDSIRGQVLGEYTLEFRDQAAHGMLNGLSA